MLTSIVTLNGSEALKRETDADMGLEVCIGHNYRGGGYSAFVVAKCGSKKLVKCQVRQIWLLSIRGQI